MSNLNDLQSFKREDYTDAAGDVRTRQILHQTSYINSQLIEEEQLFAQRFHGRNAGAGLLIGVTLVTLLGIGGVLWYLLSQSNNKPIQQSILPRNEATSLYDA